MASSEAFVVVQNWISEHYFTTEARGESFHAAVLARRKEWDGADGETVRSRFTSARRELETELAGLYDADGVVADAADRAPAVYRTLTRVLGYRTGEFDVDPDGPVELFGTPGLDERPLAVVHARPLQSLDEVSSRHDPTLLQAWEREDEESVLSVATALSSLFLAEDGPEFALVLAGRWLVVASRDRWAEGRFLGVDLQLVVERNDGRRGAEIDRALTCLSAASLAPDAEGTIWWTQVLESSVKHSVGVSQDLREGVRRSIEIIANDVVTRRRDAALDPLPADQAQPLAVQSLRYLYRILFLLYAEASPELGVLPVGAPEYTQGYSLDRLRELVQVDLTTPRSRNGTHFYDSLDRLFQLVDQGHQEPEPAEGEPVAPGLQFESLRADLFSPAAVAHIDAVGLSNQAMQDVLGRLLLSKQRRGQQRGYISYVDLGINQLGAVYEGLMSYTGFFATTDLHEVAKDGNAEKGSWVVPVTESDTINEKDFVRTEDPLTGEPVPVRHEAGAFVFRLSGRERQRSASFYTPEVLTRFTVGQALEELLDQDSHTTTAEEILSLSICEPALGSGAFAIEAVRQLAEQYLTRRQAETGEIIPPDEYPVQLQRVKAYLALHQVHGVDLNATAVELAEISLWLDTMTPGLAAPWFGLRLRRGNSLVGTKHAVYTRAQVNDKTWLTTPPKDVPLTALAEATEAQQPVEEVQGRIHHFLLPAAGWGSSAEAKEAKELSPTATAAVRQWRKSVRSKPTRTEVDLLVELSRRVERLWQLAHRRLTIAELESHRDITLWGRDVPPHGQQVSREQIEHSLADPHGAYQRLRLVMDAWCALWYWPLHGRQADPATWIAPPTHDQWLDAVRRLVGRDPRSARQSGMDTLGSVADWHALAQAEQDDLGFAQAEPVEAVLARHPWLTVCQDVAAQQGFFHWELDFAPAFGRGGFDLQVGNPPWVRPDLDSDLLLAELDPWWQLNQKSSESERDDRRRRSLATAASRDMLTSAAAEVVALRAAVSDSTRFPVLTGLRPDLYRCFMATTWNHATSRGTVSLIHPETHLTDEKAGRLRSATYRRLRRHWQIINELQLFEVHHLVSYGVHTYGLIRGQVNFLNASGLYHPETVERSLLHDGSGLEPGFKGEDGRWDLRPHAGRVQRVDDGVLRTWHAVLEGDSVPIVQTRMLYTVNRAVAAVLAKISTAPRLGTLNLQFSAGWNEKTDRQKGYFVQDWGVPDSWRDVILQGPHLHVNTPLYKTPNATMLHNLDWSATDFETLAPDAIPATAYKPAGDRRRYDAAYTHWGGNRAPARDHYRVAWRAMAANTGERTLVSALIPPGAAHVHGVASAGSIDVVDTVEAAAVLSTLLSDFAIRAAPKSTISPATVGRLPGLDREHPLWSPIMRRALVLNCVTSAYESAWTNVVSRLAGQDSWVLGVRNNNRLVLEDDWGCDQILRTALDRRNAQAELEVLVALMLHVTADELCTVYRTQFAVLYGYDHWDYTYDANGRLVPNSVLSVWRRKGDAVTEQERTATHQAGNTYVYELPFRTYDREADMREAYAEFERRLARS